MTINSKSLILINRQLMERFHLRTLLADIDKDISDPRGGIRPKGHMCFEHRFRNVPRQIGRYPYQHIKWARNLYKI